MLRGQWPDRSTAPNQPLQPASGAACLVGHYVVRHRYLPPHEFIEAVLASVGKRDPRKSIA